MTFARTEEDIISEWLDLAGETFGEYAWAGPGTWCSIARAVKSDDTDHAGHLGKYPWVKPQPFAVKILMNLFAEEGRLYLAHAGTKYFEYAKL